ncbi:E3 ubiquitin-protein ligase listerin [Podospora fimiseda]|uniref:E3 ubiquitin-protein ligase listerin n=1 Tax=Podospora fimiseda TaxID=252190 RepID=A0AAN7BNG9_9PEZI|nr:E3 ubiquitin-protein ligase listerin [Podospora fimiseda]
MSRFGTSKPSATGFGHGFGGAGALATSPTTLSYLTPPPDFSGIPQEVVVPFKNLLKKSSQTKEKALQEILAYEQGRPSDSTGPEDAVIEVYIQLYARLSIDDSAQVRQLSHQLLIQLINTAKKRIAKRLPLFVAPWVAGSFDRDRRVSKAASDGLSSFLQTKEKEDAFWRSIQTKVLEFATEASRETPDTLSDERSTTKQDAEAKYHRVMGATLCLVINLLARGDLATLLDGLTEYFKVDALWAIPKADDAFVRRSFYRLLQSTLEASPELLKPALQKAGRALVVDSFQHGQNGSASDLLRALVGLTKHFPQVWGKKHPLQRLQSFVSKGSQGGADEYWRNLDQLLSAFSGNSPSEEVVSTFLASLRTGIADRLETRAGRQQAFESYAHVLRLYLPTFTPSAAFIEDNISSLTRQYFHPNPEASIPTPQNPVFIAKAWVAASHHPDTNTQQLVQDEWVKLADSFVSRMANSLPEVSEGYKKSQDSVAAEGERWFGLVSSFASSKSDIQGPFQDAVSKSSANVLLGALDLLHRRNFKPFGAASVIQSAVRHCPALCSEQDLSSRLLPLNDSEFDFDLFVASPSFPYIVSDLNAIAGRGLEDIWKTLALSVAKLDLDSVIGVSAIKALISVPETSAFAKELAPVQEFLVRAWELFHNGKTSPDLKDLCDTTLSLDTLTSESINLISTRVVDSLRIPTTYGSGLDALDIILRKRPELLPTDSDFHVSLITTLLALADISDTPIAEKAKGLRLLLDTEQSGPHPLSRILESHLHEAGPSSLDINTLIQQALAAFKSAKLPGEDLFPSSTAWMTELSCFLDRAPNPALSIYSSMEGAYFLVQGAPDAPEPMPSRDSNGRSAPARMALFTAKLLSSGVELSSLPIQTQLDLLYLLCITDAVSADQLAAGELIGLWRNIPEQDTETEILEFTSLTSTVISTIIGQVHGWRDLDMSGDTLVEQLVNYMLQSARGFNAVAFYTSKALSNLLQAIIKAHGPLNQVDQWLTKLSLSRVTPDSTFLATALLTGLDDTLASSRTIQTLCARLISELPGYTPASPRTLPSLVLLNICASIFEAGQIPVEPRKQVMVLQQLTKWMDTPDEVDSRLAAETCKAITRIFPNVKDVYGPFWEKSIEFCLLLWQRAADDSPDERLPYLHSSLKLMQTLRSAEDPNDDLEDALTTNHAAESAGLISLLAVARNAPLTLPSQLVSSLLSRVVSKIPDAQLNDLRDVYQSISSESRDIQKASFGLLHRVLPAAQEDINLSVIMDKKPANLPEELLSLLVNAPNPDEYTDEDLSQFPAPIRSYLLAWHLVFDAYSKASYRVRTDYTENLKQSNHLGPLLGFLSDVLGHALARALDLDKEKFSPEHIRSYSIDLAESEPAERDMNWLLIHLFYLVLKYIPGLFKTWYLDCPSKQTKNTMQTWMGRFFSPLIISDELDEVVTWSSNQETGEGVEELTIKVNKPQREVVASYPVDDDIATIAFIVPQSYPLDPVEVIGVKRVAVREEAWQSWIKRIKAVIMFGNSSLVDGLMAFRRNISLALKDQEECAICYSIVAQDKSLPDKKCGTCNHYFHRVCLYKWFQNSGRNTCPLCRNAIDYLGSDTKRRRPEHE